MSPAPSAKAERPKTLIVERERGCEGDRPTSKQQRKDAPMPTRMLTRSCSRRSEQPTERRRAAPASVDVGRCGSSHICPRRVPCKRAVNDSSATRSPSMAGAGHLVGSEANQRLCPSTRNKGQSR
jgi:hypothetical protein